MTKILPSAQPSASGRKNLVCSEDALLLKNQLCFPLYAAARKIVRLYTPILASLDLTYTQYIALLALWEEDGLTVTELGDRLYLDSGTLTPLLKKMEAQGLVIRARSRRDERIVEVFLTDSGRSLREKALSIPARMVSCINLSAEDATDLHRILNRLLDYEAEGGR